MSYQDPYTVRDRMHRWSVTKDCDTQVNYRDGMQLLTVTPHSKECFFYQYTVRAETITECFDEAFEILAQMRIASAKAAGELESLPRT
jgi:hypothetical protein